MAILVGKLTLTTTGSNTLPVAMPAPIKIVPRYKVISDPQERRAIPIVIAKRATNKLEYNPNLRDRFAANGEKKAKVSRGNAVNTPATDAERERLSIICPRTGARLVKGPRRLRAINKIAAKANIFSRLENVIKRSER